MLPSTARNTIKLPLLASILEALFDESDKILFVVIRMINGTQEANHFLLGLALSFQALPNTPWRESIHLSF